MGAPTSPFAFLITTLFSLYILAVMLRFLLQVTRADFYNPVSQFLVKITNPALRPLRRIIPGIAGIDFSAVVLMLALQMLSLWLVSLIAGIGPTIVGLVIGSLIQLIGLAFNVFIFAILIQAVLSWVNPGGYNPVGQLLSDLTAPVLRPVRRWVPPVSGIDLSPLVAIIGLQFLKMLFFSLLPW